VNADPEKRRQYQTVWRARHRARLREKSAKRNAARSALLAELKSKPCLDCGGKFPPECMDFDHVRGEKRDNLSSIRDLSVPNIMEEIEKCEVVCANCHRVRTQRRRSGRA
jgi:hypothetical protein